MDAFREDICPISVVRGEIQRLQHQENELTAECFDKIGYPGCGDLHKDKWFDKPVKQKSLVVVIYIKNDYESRAFCCGFEFVAGGTRTILELRLENKQSLAR